MPIGVEPLPRTRGPEIGLRSRKPSIWVDAGAGCIKGPHGHTQLLAARVHELGCETIEFIHSVFANARCTASGISERHERVSLPPSPSTSTSTRGILNSLHRDGHIMMHSLSVRAPAFTNKTIALVPTGETHLPNPPVFITIFVTPDLPSVGQIIHLHPMQQFGFVVGT